MPNIAQNEIANLKDDMVYVKKELKILKEELDSVVNSVNDNGSPDEYHEYY